MKTIAACLATLALSSICLAQTTIYWTGNGDRWGASPHTKWSLSPGGTDYYQLQGGASVHMNYDHNNMVGITNSVLINRQGVIMNSLTMAGSAPDNGFALTLTACGFFFACQMGARGRESPARQRACQPTMSRNTNPFERA